jgi:hypothetical protein
LIGLELSFFGCLPLMCLFTGPAFTCHFPDLSGWFVMEGTPTVFKSTLFKTADGWSFRLRVQDLSGILDAWNLVSVSSRSV